MRFETRQGRVVEILRKAATFTVVTDGQSLNTFVVIDSAVVFESIVVVVYAWLRPGRRGTASTFPGAVIGGRPRTAAAVADDEYGGRS
ncbi:hypothetical protein ISF_02322 [Cordyceps fumosorosea ARSEF 2679]|uniref:Uncharacterized protein n=1 Tax=Cordyceps fumosorosea (strain ARSEF 2679) TaxID=1081104 RepID=A0A168BNL4_CORFA|nr:hypothetical protein ISF_02322 [Cordyceps fumosorosea ARSEF 2679]OAA70348.1 hypothetical protein ISF_02322 [Cordyceps fumosorosea ARSEF 2679]